MKRSTMPRSSNCAGRVTGGRRVEYGRPDIHLARHAAGPTATTSRAQSAAYTPSRDAFGNRCWPLLPDVAGEQFLRSYLRRAKYSIPRSDTATPALAERAAIDCISSSLTK